MSVGSPSVRRLVPVGKNELDEEVVLLYEPPPPPPLVEGFEMLGAWVLYATNTDAEHVYIVAYPHETVAIFDPIAGIPLLQVVFGSLVNHVVPKLPSPPCCTRIPMVD